MLKASALLCAILAVATAQPQSPFHSFSNGPPSSSPFGHGPGPGSRGPPGGRGPPPGFPSPNYKPRQNAPSKLFSWLGNTMSKFSGLPKLQYHNPKSKPTHGHPGFGPSSSPQNAPPTYFSNGLILPQIPNSVYEGGSSPFEGSSVSFAPSNSIEHGPVNYRTQSGGPPNFSSGGPPSFSSGGPPSFSSGGPPSFSSGGPPSFSSGGPPSFSSGRPGPQQSYSSTRPGQRPSFSTGRPGSRPYSSGGPPSFSSRPPPSYSQFSSEPPSYQSADSPYSNSPFSSQSQQGIRDNLEVFPSQQISYQSQTVSQNEPGYDDALSGIQNLYGSQSNSRPSYQSRPNNNNNNYEQQSSYSQHQPQQVSNDGSNYGATFHTVSPVYDIQDHFKASPSDLSQSASNVQQQQQQNENIHDTAFSTLVNEYSAHADAATSSSEQSMMSQLQNGDLAAAASSSPIQGVQILGQGVNAEGNPVFEVMANGNSPTFDGHPVDLSKLISMIEPGAEIDTLPQYNQDATSGSASEQHPVYVQAPTRLDMESEAAMSSAVSGNKKFVSGFTQSDKKSNIDNNDDELNAMASEARPTIVKPDGSRLTKGDDDKLIKEHFDKEIIFDDLQDNKDKGFIILGVSPDNETGDIIYTHTTTNGTGTVINNDDLLAIVQQLRNSAAANSQFSVVDTPENSNNKLAQNPDDSTVTTVPNDELKTVTSTPNIRWKTTQHPNHNYNIRNSSRIKFHDDYDRGRETPVINPIFDSVRQQRGSSDSNISSASDNETYDDTSLVVDDEDDDQMFPDDMTIETAGDLAASASRNVKSVATIVTPPPTYVKIKNKYKKLNGQVSSTSAPPTTTSLTPPPLALSDNVDEAFSESLSRPSNRNENSRDISNYDNNSSITSTPSSSLQVEKDADDSGSNDSILKLISTISSNRSSDIGTKDGNQKPIRYPVYRGKSSS